MRDFHCSPKTQSPPLAPAGGEGLGVMGTILPVGGEGDNPPGNPTTTRTAHTSGLTAAIPPLWPLCPLWLKKHPSHITLHITLLGRARAGKTELR